jgi:ribosomal protein S18 acetylase RimI-like enzyme
MSDNTPFIRPAIPADAAFIAKLGARLFQDAFGTDNHPEDMAHYLAANFAPAVIAAELVDPAAKFFLAYAADTLVGYAKLDHRKKPKCVTGPNPVELQRLYVDQTIIGKGYGAALMRVCLQRAQQAGYQTIWLGVWKKNQRAIRFYQKWGFVKMDEQQFVLGSDIQHDWVMARPLTGEP